MQHKTEITTEAIKDSPFTSKSLLMNWHKEYIKECKGGICTWHNDYMIREWILYSNASLFLFFHFKQSDTDIK